MRTVKTLFLMLLCISCTLNKNNQKNIAEVTPIENTKTIEQPMLVNFPQPYIEPPYRIKIETETINDIPYLVIAMDLKKGSYFASPYSKKELSGVFNISTEKNDRLTFEDKLIETPQSTENNQSVNWVRENTVYRQKLNIKSKANFEVSGNIQFVIEPKCTLEKIRFTITQREGKLKVENIRLKDNC